MVLTATACARPQPLTTLTPETRKAMGVAQLFARKLGMAGNCLTPGPRERYSITDAAENWTVEIEPPLRSVPKLLVTVSKRDYRIVRAQKVSWASP